MRRWSSWIAIVVLSAACSRTASAPPVPAGWMVEAIPACCRIAIPPGSTLVPGDDPVDSAVYILKGRELSAIITVTRQGGGVPLPGSGSDYRTADFQLDGRPASAASYRPADGKVVHHRSLVWTFRGTNDGTGTNLRIDATCERAGCSYFQAMVRSLSIPR